MRMWFLSLAFLFSIGSAHAESLVVQSCGTLPLAYLPGATRNDTVDTNGNKCISGSISASFASFHLESVLTPLTAGTVSGTSSSFTAGKTIVATNNGSTNTVYCQPGATSTLSSQPITPGNWFAFATSAETTIACITSTSTTPVNFSVGTGGPAGTGGGAGGGSGGNVTIVGPLGQALAAASIPVVLPATQIATLTPPSNTGYSTSANQTNKTAFTQLTDGTNGTGTFTTYGTAPTGNWPGVNAFVTNTNANGQATAANSSPVVLPAAQVTADPCTLGTKQNFTIATSSGTLQLVAPSGSTQVYICSLFTIGATASIQNIVGGTGATCTTGTPVAIAGSTTAANGMSFAANGGFTFGNGGGTVLRTTTAGHGVCLIQSATAALAGGGTYVQQ